MVKSQITNCNITLRIPKGFFVFKINIMNTEQIDFSKLPSRSVLYKFTDDLFDFLFPIDSSASLRYQVPGEKQERLEEILLDIIKPLIGRLNSKPEEVVKSFFESLDTVKTKLLADAEFFLQSDPAAEGIEEVILAYPGFYAIAIHRLAHELSKLKVRIIPRVISEYTHTKTGIDIHPGATIGTPFFIDHGTGVVIGQTTIIGNNVKMYQGVTLGALAVKKESQGSKRHPTIGDNVILYAGCCILGGDSVIGHDSVIGGNVWLTESVAPLSVVYHQSEVHIRDKSEMNYVIDFVI